MTKLLSQDIPAIAPKRGYRRSNRSAR